MRNTTQTSPEKQAVLRKVPLMFSTVALILMTTPAWISGIAAAVLFSGLFCLAIWRFLPDHQNIWEEDAFHRGGLLCLSLLVCSALGSNFYNTWMDSRYPQKLAQLLHIPLAWFLGVCTIVVVVLCLPAVGCLLEGAVRHGAQGIAPRCMVSESEKHKTVSMKWALWILFLIYVVGFSAVLRTNFYYMDDNGRAAFGYKTWDYFGRYLSTGLSTILHMGNHLTDIAPLPQLIALWILAAASILLLYVICQRTRFYFWELGAVVILGLNPYFLECLSFRFDAPYMAISVLAGILPLLYYRSPGFVYVLASMLGVLGVCTSYQAATGIFPILVIALMLRMWNQREKGGEIVAFCAKSVAGYGLGLVYFKLVIMKPANAGYVSNALPDGSGLIANTIRNLRTYYRFVLTDFKPLWLILVLLAVAAFVLLTVSCSKQKKTAAAVLSCAALCLMLLLCFGIYPVLESTLFSPRAMYGFGVLLAILGVMVVQGEGRIPLKLPVLLLSWAFFVFSFTYGNVLNLQKNYTEFRIHLVMEDLNDLELPQPEERLKVRLTGDIGLTPILDNMPQNYQMLNRLMPSTFAGGDDLTEYQFYDYYGIQNFADCGSEEDCPADMPVWKDSGFHTIRVEGNCVLVELK